MSTLAASDINFKYPENDELIIKNFSHSFKQQITTGLLGPNGCGKSTLMALLAGAFLPNSGSVLINAKESTSYKNESELENELIFIFQNMEFETEEKTGTLLEAIAKNSQGPGQPVLTELIKTFSIKNILNTPINKISKGELQKTILCFTLLSKAKIVIMDEPVFALSHDEALEVLTKFKKIASKKQTTVIISLHDIDLMEKICDEVVLFKKDGSFEACSAKEKLLPQKLEEVYGIPYALLKKQEYIYSALYNQEHS